MRDLAETLHTVRFFVWLVAWEAVGIAAAAYWTPDHSRGAQVVIAVSAFIAVTSAALLLPLATCWVTAPVRQRDEARAALRDAKLPQPLDPRSQRIGFKAVISEAESAIYKYNDGYRMEMTEDAWATAMDGFLEASIGPGEARRFRRDLDLEDTPLEEWNFSLFGVNKWLDDLIARSDQIAISPKFNPDEWTGRFS